VPNLDARFHWHDNRLVPRLLAGVDLQCNPSGVKTRHRADFRSSCFNENIIVIPAHGSVEKPYFHTF
jgi:hypothetical protein